MVAIYLSNGQGLVNKNWKHRVVLPRIHNMSFSIGLLHVEHHSSSEEEEEEYKRGICGLSSLIDVKDMSTRMG